jgi:MEMO1 family protein
MPSYSPETSARARVHWRALLLLLALPLSGTAVCGTGPNREAGAMKGTRPSALAGSWYPADPALLASSVDAHIAQGRPLAEIAGRRPIAVIVPHAGHEWSGDAAGHVYRLLEGEAGAGIERVILIGPSHYGAFRGASILPVQAFATPLGDVPLDAEVVRALSAGPDFVAADSAQREEHSLEIQLPFLQRVLNHPFRIVPILVSRSDPAGWKRLAAALAPFLDERTLLLISSDFTHFGSRFGYIPFRADLDLNLRRLDKGALVPIVSVDPTALAHYADSTDITVCGIQPIEILLEMLRRPELVKRWNGVPEARVLEYYRSADRTGDFDGSVSYAAVAFFRPGDLRPGEVFPERLRAVHVKGEERLRGGGPGTAAPQGDAGVGAPLEGPVEFNSDEKRFLLGLARHTLEEVLADRPEPECASFPERCSAEKLSADSGVFVTLTEDGMLRGCIGSIVGVEPLTRAVIHNAVNAALNDPRFPPVSIGELAKVEIELSVLTPLRPVGSAEEIVIGRDGVVLERGGRRAVFLPQVAPEQGWDRATMLDNLAMKAGLPRDAWRSGANFQVFEARVFSEGELKREP